MVLMELAARLREETGSGAAHRVRFAGGLPGIVYGQAGENLTIAVQVSDFDRLVRQSGGGAIVIDLKVEGAQEKNLKVLIKEVQRDPVTARPIHLDLLRISMDKPVNVVVPVHLTGLAEGVKTHGGFMDHILREVEVLCLPDRIPEFLSVDVTPLLVGEALHVGDLPIEGLQVVTPADRVIVAIHGKAAELAEEAAVAPAAEGATAEAAEPAAESKEKDKGKDKEKDKSKGKGKDKD